MYIYIYICIFICIHTRVCVHMHASICMKTCTYIYNYFYIHICRHIYIARARALSHTHVCTRPPARPAGPSRVKITLYIIYSNECLEVGGRRRARVRGLRARAPRRRAAKVGAGPWAAPRRTVPGAVPGRAGARDLPAAD